MGNPITDYLERMINKRLASQYAPESTLPDDQAQTSAGGQWGAGAFSPHLPDWASSLPQVSFGAVPTMTPGIPGSVPSPKAPPLGHGTPGAPTQPSKSNNDPRFDPSMDSNEPNKTIGGGTKLDQPGTLSFGWAGDALQAYDPKKAGGFNATPELGSKLAESRNRGFMGHSGSISFPTPDPRSSSGAEQGPGYSPSQTDWSKVANPMAFEGYRERPERADIERYMQDPNGKEQAQANIEQTKQIAIVKAQAHAQGEEMQAAADRQRTEVGKLSQLWIDQDNAERQKAGKPPMTFNEAQMYRQKAQETYSGKYPANPYFG